MAKSLKQYSPALQLVLVFTFYIAFLILAGFISIIISAPLTGYGVTELKNADASIPSVFLTWKLLTFIEPIFMYLLPALLFARLMSRQPVEWLHLNKPIRLRPALFVVAILLLGIPILGVLYDWNCAWGIAQSSLQQVEDFATASNAIMKTPHVGYLFMHLVFFALVSAIARECLFRGIVQQILVKMMPKAPWIAIIISSIIYSASYVQWQWFAPVIFVGIQLGAIYYLTGNLWLSILGNFIFSSSNWVEAYFYQQGWSNEDPLHPSAMPWYLAAISLVLTAVLIWYSRKSIPKPIVEIEYQEDIASIGK
jgi:branched-subunit amino acid transport protein